MPLKQVLDGWFGGLSSSLFAWPNGQGHCNEEPTKRFGQTFLARSGRSEALSHDIGFDRPVSFRRPSSHLEGPGVEIRFAPAGWWFISLSTFKSGKATVDGCEIRCSHHLRNPRMIRFICKYQRTMVSHGFKVVRTDFATIHSITAAIWILYPSTVAPFRNLWFLDCYWVGSLDLNFLGNQGGVPLNPPKS